MSVDSLGKALDAVWIEGMQFFPQPEWGLAQVVVGHLARPRPLAQLVAVGDPIFDQVPVGVFPPGKMPVIVLVQCVAKRCK